MKKGNATSKPKSSKTSILFPVFEKQRPFSLGLFEYPITLHWPTLKKTTQLHYLLFQHCLYFSKIIFKRREVL